MVISLLLWLTLRRFTDVLMTMVPLLVAGAVTMEICVLIGLPLNFANIVALGYAWQRGLVPVGLAAMLRAIELNGVAVDANKAAFSLGRLAAADPAVDGRAA